MSNEQEDLGAPRIRLGPLAASMALGKAGGEKVSRQHLDDAIRDLVEERNALAAGQRDAATDAIVAQINASEARMVERVSGTELVLLAGIERLLNGINGIRHLFGVYAVRLTGGDIDQALREINERVDASSKPIAVSKSEFEARREREAETAAVQAADHGESEMALQHPNDPMAIGDGAPVALREAEDGLEL